MERVYKTMKNIGGANIAVGVVILVMGLIIGVLNIVCGAKLLKDKANITF